MSETIYIYTLCDAKDGRPFYVGTTKNIKRRYWQHCKDANEMLEGSIVNTLKTLRIVERLLETGCYPDMKVIGECAESERLYTEKLWIDLYESYGYELLCGESDKYAIKRSYHDYRVIWQDTYQLVTAFRYARKTKSLSLAYSTAARWQSKTFEMSWNKPVFELYSKQTVECWNLVSHLANL